MFKMTPEHAFNHSNQLNVWFYTLILIQDMFESDNKSF